MPTAQEIAITTAHTAASKYEFWRGPRRGVLVETTITAAGAWLPTTGAGWTDASGTVVLSEGLDYGFAGRGYDASFTVADEARATWADDLAVAIVAQHWDGSAWSPRALEMWGFLDGSARKRAGLDLGQTGRRTITYAGYWGLSNVPAHRIGRRNLAEGASVTASTAPLATPASEAGVEYLAQDSCAGAKMVDQNGDTVAVSSLLASARPPGGIGTSHDPHLAWLYAGRTSRVIGAGNEPVAIGIAFEYNVTPWGNFATPATVPDLYDMGSEVRSDAHVISSIASSTYFARMLPQVDGILAGFLQWNLGVDTGVPMRLTVDIKAGATGSIGRTLDIETSDGTTSIHSLFTLPPAFKQVTVEIPANARGLVVLRFRAGQFERGNDYYFELKNLRLASGYNDETMGRLFLAYDNGAGEERWIGLYNDRLVDSLVIPPGKMVFVVDDAGTFRAKFDPGDQQVLQVKVGWPGLFFGPGIGKLKLAYNTNPNRFLYSGGTTPYTGGGTLIDELNFTTNGFAWQPYQGLQRINPVITGTWTAIDYPQANLRTASDFGPSYWTFQLPAYVPPKLTVPGLAGQARITVDDADKFPPSGTLYVGDPPGPYGAKGYSGKDGDSLVLTSALVGSYPVGTAVWTQWAGARQTGHLIDGIEVRRKEGTPLIGDGKVLYSNLAAPASVTPDYERGTDWLMFGNFTEAWGPVVALKAPAGVVQAGHVTMVVARMADDGRAKVNELVIWEHKPGSGSGDWGGHGAGTIGDVMAHLLTQHGNVPASKVAVVANSTPIGDLPIAPAYLASILDTLEGPSRQKLWRVWADPYNAVTIAPDPANPAYSAPAPVWTWDASNWVGELALTYRRAHAVAQVKVVAREVGTFRTHFITYPPRPLSLGEVVEVRDVPVRSAREAFDLAEAIFRTGNARREGTIAAGACPWLRPYQRHLLNVSALDSSGDVIGINIVVTGFRTRVTMGDFGVEVDTQISVAELAL